MPSIFLTGTMPNRLCQLIDDSTHTRISSFPHTKLALILHEPDNLFVPRASAAGVGLYLPCLAHRLQAAKLRYTICAKHYLR